MKIKNFTLPLSGEDIKSLKKGDVVSLNGELYTMRDAAHKRFFDALDKKEEPPVDLNGATVFYAGPSDKKDGEIIGSIGPTTSSRMDFYTPRLIKECGLRVTIGKGNRSEDVIRIIKENGGVYLAAIGGAGALYRSAVTNCRIAAYADLGCEAIYKLTVKDFLAVVR